MARQAPLDRVLIVGPAWIGDMVMSQVLYKQLRKRHPETEIDVLAPRATLPLVSRMAEVSLGISLALGHGELKFGYRSGLGESLKARRYKQAIVLPNSLKSALVPFFAEIPLRTGYRGEYRYVLVNDMRMMRKDRLPRMVDRFVALGVPASARLPEIQPPQLMVDSANLAALMENLGLHLDRPILGICPGAEFGDAKKWPEQHFAELSEHAVQKGMQVWIFGGPNDAGSGEAILSNMAPETRGFTTDLTGKTSILDVIDLLARASLVVSNDSGLMHVAGAVGCPTAVLYGSSSADFTPPLGEAAESFSLGLSCSPCFKRTCPLGHKNCLNDLKPATLFGLVDRYAGTPVR